MGYPAGNSIAIQNKGKVQNHSSAVAVGSGGYL